MEPDPKAKGLEQVDGWEEAEVEVEDEEAVSPLVPAAIASVPTVVRKLCTNWAVRVMSSDAPSVEPL